MLHYINPNCCRRRLIPRFLLLLGRNDRSYYGPLNYVVLDREHQVSHIAREKNKLINRVRRIRGQIEAVERALEQEIGCADVLQLIAGARGAINGLMLEVMEDHIRMHVVDLGQEHEAERTQAAEELIDVVRTYLK